MPNSGFSFQQVLADIQRTLRRFGINPLLALGLLLVCLISPRFFFLVLIGYGVYWYGKNVGFGSRRSSRGTRPGRGGGGGKGRRR
jgi:hypothetical protein